MSDDKYTEYPKYEDHEKIHRPCVQDAKSPGKVQCGLESCRLDIWGDPYCEKHYWKLPTERRPSVENPRKNSLAENTAIIAKKYGQEIVDLLNKLS